MMYKVSFSFLVVSLLAGHAWPQAADLLQLPAGNTIPVILEKRLDARKNKVGDEVAAKTTEHVKSDGRVVIQKGSKIMGHVTETMTRTKEVPRSALGIVFDRAVLKDGREIPLALAIQAVAPAESSTLPMMAMTPATPGGTAGGTPTSGATSGPMSDPNAGTPGRIASPADFASGASDRLTSTGGLTPSCHGVLGIEGLVLLPEDPNRQQGSTIVSQTRNVHLDSGTQMMLRVIAK